MRADAVRNRAKVLDAARAAFAAEGLAVPLDEIARRAGVGAGTVYRHFPTKEALFEAVIADRLLALAGDAESRLADDGVDAGEAFFGFFFALIEDAEAKADLAEALMAAGVHLQPETRHAAGRLTGGFSRLLERAQRAGAVRGDVTVTELHALVVGAMAAEKRAAGEPGKMTRIIADGLRA
ncbi:helix-turn-helix transcriptional regulator [Actinospica sp. MGRD01-02]|uniref:Helix-turn-helix transcriptional regulator n=2 Tax=Actinospica acidithermotolerans TaxID=2828514 RepID=A0A941EFU4_9ACTN|nr:helix-turn-helix transcriptional regulator [Actinospica acidithermotolerans]